MNWKRGLQLFVLALVIFALDGMVKAYTHYTIPPMHAASFVYPYDGIGVFQGWHGIDFSIVHVINKGMAWGLFAKLQQVLLYVRMAIIGGLLTYLVFVQGDSFRKLCLTLVAAGAVGNVADYFIYGHVVDMFYFVFWGYSYPVFNIADSSIFCGIALMLLQAGWKRMRGGSTERHELS